MDRTASASGGAGDQSGTAGDGSGSQVPKLPLAASGPPPADADSGRRSVQSARAGHDGSSLQGEGLPHAPKPKSARGSRRKHAPRQGRPGRRFRPRHAAYTVSQPDYDPDRSRTLSGQKRGVRQRVEPLPPADGAKPASPPAPRKHRTGGHRKRYTVRVSRLEPPRAGWVSDTSLSKPLQASLRHPDASVTATRPHKAHHSHRGRRERRASSVDGGSASRRHANSTNAQGAAGGDAAAQADSAELMAHVEQQEKKLQQLRKQLARERRATAAIRQVMEAEKKQKEQEELRSKESFRLEKLSRDVEGQAHQQQVAAAKKSAAAWRRRCKVLEDIQTQERRLVASLGRQLRLDLPGRSKKQQQQQQQRSRQSGDRGGAAAQEDDSHLDTFVADMLAVLRSRVKQGRGGAKKGTRGGGRGRDDVMARMAGFAVAVDYFQRATRLGAALKAWHGYGTRAHALLKTAAKPDGAGGFDVDDIAPPPLNINFDGVSNDDAGAEDDGSLSEDEEQGKQEEEQGPDQEQEQEQEQGQAPNSASKHRNTPQQRSGRRQQQRRRGRRGHQKRPTSRSSPRSRARSRYRSPARSPRAKAGAANAQQQQQQQQQSSAPAVQGADDEQAAALMIQRHARGRMERRRLEDERRAARTIQRHARGRRDRQRVKEEKAAASTIQRHVKGRLTRKRLREESKAAAIIQRRARARMGNSGATAGPNTSSLNAKSTSASASVTADADATDDLEASTGTTPRAGEHSPRATDNAEPLARDSEDEAFFSSGGESDGDDGVPAIRRHSVGGNEGGADASSTTTTSGTDGTAPTPLRRTMSKHAKVPSVRFASFSHHGPSAALLKGGVDIAQLFEDEDGRGVWTGVVCVDTDGRVRVGAPRRLQVQVTAFDYVRSPRHADAGGGGGGNETEQQVSELIVELFDHATVQSFGTASVRSDKLEVGLHRMRDSLPEEEATAPVLSSTEDVPAIVVTLLRLLLVVDDFRKDRLTIDESWQLPAFEVDEAAGKVVRRAALRRGLEKQEEAMEGIQENASGDEVANPVTVDTDLGV